MLKKIAILSLVSFLSACSTLKTDDDLSNAIESVKNKPTYFEVVGQKLQPNNLTKGDHRVIDSTVSVTANIAKEGQVAPSSTIKMVLGYFENHTPYKYALVNGNEVKIKEYKVGTSTCTDFCKAMQYFTFPVSNEDLLKAVGSEFTFKLRANSGGQNLVFSIPGTYVEALVNGYKANVLPVNVAAIADTPADKTTSPIKMSQDLFVKASDTEKEQFTDWAFKNRKSIDSPLNGEGKILPMLEYWYEKATSDEKAEILTWVLAQ